MQRLSGSFGGSSIIGKEAGDALATVNTCPCDTPFTRRDQVVRIDLYCELLERNVYHTTARVQCGSGFDRTEPKSDELLEGVESTMPTNSCWYCASISWSACVL